MTFTSFGSYHKDSYDYDEYIAKSTQYVLNILKGIMTAFQYQKVWYFCY